MLKMILQVFGSQSAPCSALELSYIFIVAPAALAIMTCLNIAGASGAQPEAKQHNINLEIIEPVKDKLVLSRASLPLCHSTRSASTAVIESPSLRLLPAAGSPRAIFSIKVTGIRYKEDSDKVKETHTDIFSSTMTASNGRWRCPSCPRTGKAIAGMEQKFAPDREQEQ